MAKTTRLARSIQRQNGLFPESATPEQKIRALRHDIYNLPAQEAGSMGQIAWMFAQFGLPHSDPDPDSLNPKEAYRRENGDYIFRITPLVDDGGIPWGVAPRLILAYVCTMACLTKSRTIHFGTHLSSFLRDELGLQVTGGKNGTIPRYKEQAYRLFTSSISVIPKRKGAMPNNDEISIEPAGEIRGNRKRVGFMKFADSLEIWDPIGDRSPEEVWQSTIELDATFFEKATTGMVPIDWRIVRGIQNSSLALDLYFWLTYRMKTVTQKTPIPLLGASSIYEQLGCGYADNPSGRFAFRKKLQKQLDDIRNLWPGLHAHLSQDGQYLELFPSPTSIASRPSNA